MDASVLSGLLVISSALLAGGLTWLAMRINQTRTLDELIAVRNEIDEIRTKYSTSKEELAAANQKAERINSLEDQVGSLNSKLGQSEADKARLEERLRQSETQANAQLQQYNELVDQTKVHFRAIANEVVQGNSKAFLENAALTLNPFSDTFTRYEALLQKMEGERQQAFGGINSELSNVRSQLEAGQSITSRLVNALRAAPKTRGRWGEQSLQRVMELAGMVQYCDFDLEKSYQKLDETLRPDAVLHLAGERHIIVDAKAPIAAFLDSVEAEGDEQREAHLIKHAAQLRERMHSLASRAYWEKLEGTPDCVVMFVPGDNFFSAAIERDSMLFDDAVSKRVLIATPTTFIALAKAIAYGWRQQKLAESANQVSQLGRELYQRLTVMGSHLTNMGSGLKRSVEEYNRFVGSLEGSVMPQARKFQEMGVDGTSKVIPLIEPLESEVREVRTGRDLTFTDKPLIQAVPKEP